MPYFITDQHPECPNWAVVKEDGELLACHDTKDSAVEQMVGDYGHHHRFLSSRRLRAGRFADKLWPVRHLRATLSSPAGDTGVCRVATGRPGDESRLLSGTLPPTESRAGSTQLHAVLRADYHSPC